MSLRMIIVIVLFLVQIAGAKAIQTQSPQTMEDINTRTTLLQEEKLRQEVIQLTYENERYKSAWYAFSQAAPLVTTLVAVLGLLATIWKQIKQQESERRQRAIDSQRLQDERFADIVKNLSAQNPALQAAAAVNIMNYLKPDNNAYHHQVFMILHAALKFKHSEAVRSTLIHAFGASLKLQPQAGNMLDLSSCDLRDIDLTGVDLTEADLGFANLRRANLSETNLFRVRGIQVNLEKARLSKANLSEARLQEAKMESAQLHNANLVSTKLKNANMRNTQFHQAKLQSAHFDGADLTGARFEQADLNDAFFNGAVIDSATIKSLFKAYNWEKAHFDKGIRDQLDALAAGH